MVAQDVSGHVILLYPNADSRSLRITAQVPLLFPAEGEPEIEVAAPFGREYIKAFVTPTPLFSAETWVDGTHFLEAEASSGQSEGGIRGLRGNSWAVASMSLNTAPARTIVTRGSVPPVPTAQYSEDPLRLWNTSLRQRLAETVTAPEPTTGISTPLHDGRLIVGYETGRASRSVGDAVGVSSQGQVRVVSPRNLGHTGIDAARRALVNVDGVRTVVPNYYFRADSDEGQSFTLPEPIPLWDLQWPLYNPFYRSSEERVDIRWWEANQQQRVGAPQIIVAVLDTGLRTDIDGWSTMVWQNLDEIPNNHFDDDGNGHVDDVYGWDFVEGDNNPNDPTLDRSHGTAIASVIASDVNATGLVPAAENVRIMPLRVLDTSRNGTLSNISAGINYAIRNGAQIINLSLSMVLPAQDVAFERMLSDLFSFAEDRGVLLVMASGNQGLDTRRAFVYPARVSRPNTLTVGAHDILGQKNPRSNYGPYVDLLAPGSDVLTVQGARRVVVEHGTSIAAPFVSAAAATLLSAHPDWGPAQLRQAILSSVTTSTSADVASKGRLNLEAALKR